LKKNCSKKPSATKTVNHGPWTTKQIARRTKIKTERAEIERNDTPKENEGELIPQIGLNKYEQTTGLKRRRGMLVIMVANGDDLDHIEAAYEALAVKKTITVELENSTTTLNMVTKEDKAKRGMLTTEENEIQDNANVITENRNQFKMSWALSRRLTLWLRGPRGY
jgi:hypothetical protein